MPESNPNLDLFTERLSLLPLTSDDLDVAIALFTDESVTRYVGDSKTPEEIEKMMLDSIRRGGDGCIGIWCVRRIDSGEKLGTAVLLPMPVDTEDTEWHRVVPGRMPDVDVEIGYLLKSSAWGRGYATEAAARLLRFAFEDAPLDEVVAVTDPANHASQRVLTKIGMIADGMRRAYMTECTAFRLTRSQWMARRAEARG